MARWSIVSRAGRDWGIWDGDTPEEALLRCHRDAGYGSDQVRLDGGQLRFADQDAKELLGDVCDWDIREVD